ncbi:MAG TPA: hypothetical protein VJ793_20595 [Anaerolineae bacterium]|nr:hypothetical protein [Anaerolineae bacterium]
MRRALAFLTLVSLLLFPASSAFAEGAVTVTQTFHNFTETEPDIDQCTGAPGNVTLTYNGVVHMTTTPNGAFHLTGTFTGDFVFVPVNPALPTASGNFTVWFGDNFNEKNENHTFTFTVHGTSSDGSDVQWHITAHTTMNANGEVLVEFFKLNCP